MAEGRNLMYATEAETLLQLLESDFGMSGRDVRLEAIRLELEAAYDRGRAHEVIESSMVPNTD